jgi:P-type Cu+ transporter
MSSETDRPASSAPPADDEQLPFAVVPLEQTLAKWVCPACTGIESDQPRTCPRCGRDLVPGVLADDDTQPDREMRSMTRLLWLALVLGLPLIALGTIDVLLPRRPIRGALGDQAFLAIQAILCTPIVLVCGAPFFLRAWRSVRTLQFNIFTLIGLGAGAAYVYSLVALIYAWSGTAPLTRPSGQDVDLTPEVRGGVEVIAPYQSGAIDSFFESAAMIVLLVLLGQVLEIRARARARIAIHKLLPLVPDKARVVLPDGREEERALDVVRPGDLVRVRPGERVPVDGIIREGATTVDESMLTGEAIRAGRGAGAGVLAGSENGLGTITVEATRVKDDTVLDQVIGIVARAQERRVTLDRTTDRVAHWFVPLVLLIALGAFVGWWAFGPADSALTYASICAVGVFIVACPCAVGLASPAAVTAGMRRGARSGLIFRDPATLERLAAVDTVLFDKTGTLTEGRPKLIAVAGNRGVSENAALALAAAVERGSDHPLGLAIVWEAVRRKLEILPAENVEAIPGKGVRGVVDGRTVVVGRIGFLQECGVYQDFMLSEAMSHRKQGHGVVFVAEGTRCVGVVVMNDQLRATSHAAVEQLRGAGLRLALVTGDHLETGQGVAAAVGIDEVIADTLPAEKFAVVQKLKGEGRVVAMCGDGVNDAPALVAADVGIAVGTGTRTAIGTAGMTLAKPDLRSIVSARDLSRSTVRTIRQNLVLAFAFNLVALPIAAGALIPLGGGPLNSVWAAAAMSVSSLLVIANSLRLLARRVK